MAVNTDGAVKGVPGRAACAEAFRSEHGSWQGGFKQNLGVCTALEAEFWAIHNGLTLAWDRGRRKIEVQTDSKVAVTSIQRGQGGLFASKIL